jgi:hypothetical protein
LKNSEVELGPFEKNTFFPPDPLEVEAARCRNVELEALVVVGGRSNVETIGCMWRQDVRDPGLSYIWALVPSGARGDLLKS